MTPDPTPPPVVPQATMPPFFDISDDAFEGFCADLIDASPEFSNVHRVGREGDAQGGIDAVGDHESGEHWAFQFKRVSTFGPAAFQRAVGEATYAADRYVLALARRASAQLREAEWATPTWRVWDADDLARRLRRLPDPDARRLLETYFGPHWREATLGRTGPAAFRRWAEHFRPLTNPRLLFNHDRPLIGHQDVVEQLLEFLANDDQRIAVLSGRGGIGKSKILHAFGEQLTQNPTQWTVLFADEGTPFDANSLDDVPPAPCLLVVDDVHLRTDLRQLLAFAARRVWPTKLLLSTRPEGREPLRASIYQSGFQTRQVNWLSALSQLPSQEGEQLARLALGSGHEHLARALYEATRDCPLVTVIGGRLLAERHVLPALLERDRDFRDAALSGFLDAALGAVGAGTDRRLTRDVLRLVSALQPIYPDNADFRRAAAAFLRVRESEFISTLGELEDAGVVLRVGYSRRVVPDVLADYVLGEACLTSSGMETGYGNELLEAFSAVAFDRLLANLAAVDWRVRMDSGGPTRLLDRAWSAFEERYRSGDNLERQRLLRLVRSAAGYQPERILALAEWTLSHPAPDGPDAGLLTNQHSTVCDMLPELIEACAYGDQLDRACDLLWRLSRDDDRETGPLPNHPMRALIRLIDYSSTKPVEVSERIADQAISWLHDPEVASYKRLPFELLERVFAKEGTEQVSDGEQIHLRSVVISVKATSRVRTKVIGVAVQRAQSKPLRMALAAIKMLAAALHDPLGLTGRYVTMEERAGWEPEQLLILGGLADIVATEPAAIVRLRVREAAMLVAERGDLPTLRERARLVVEKVGDDFELHLARALVSPWPGRWDLGEKLDAETIVERSAQRTRATAAAVNDSWPAPEQLAAELSTRILELREGGIEPNPGALLAMILGSAPIASAIHIADAILRQPGHALEPYLWIVLHTLRPRDDESALDIAERAVRLDRDVLNVQIAALYGETRWTVMNDRDRRLLAQVIAAAGGSSDAIAMGGLETLAATRPDETRQIALRFEPGADSQRAEALARQLNPSGPLFGALDDNDLDQVIDKFATPSTIDNYYCQIFLAAAAARRPLAVARMLIKRIDALDANSPLSFHALPYELPGAEWWSSLDKEQRKQALIEVRDSMLYAGPLQRMMLPELFGWIAGEWGVEAQDVVLERIESDDEGRVTAAVQLLGHAPRDLPFRETAFVERVLAGAAAASVEAERAAFAALRSSSYNATKHRRVMHVQAQDEWIREQAAAAAARSAPGSRLRRLYEELQLSAEAAIEHFRKVDEELTEPPPR